MGSSLKSGFLVLKTNYLHFIYGLKATMTLFFFEFNNNSHKQINTQKNKQDKKRVLKTNQTLFESVTNRKRLIMALKVRPNQAKRFLSFKKCCDAWPAHSFVHSYVRPSRRPFVRSFFRQKIVSIRFKQILI